MNYTWIILGRDLKSLFTPSGSKNRRQRMGPVAAGMGLIVLAAALGYGSVMLFGYLSRTLGAMPELKRAVEINLLNGDALFVLMMVLLVGLQSTYKVIYESDDVGFLLSQPIPVSSIFDAKFITSFVTLLAMTASFGLPVWLAFGYSRGLGAAFYVITIIGFLLLLLASHAAVTLLLMTAMRFLPGRRMKQLFIAFSAIFGILIAFGSQLLSARMSRTNDVMALIQQIGKGQLSKTWYLPTTWLANGVLGTIPEFEINPVGGWMALVVFAIGGTFVATLVSSAWYLRGWSGRSEELGAGKTRKSSAGAYKYNKNRVQGGYWSVLRKDLQTLWRDPVVWYTLVVSAIGLGFFAYNIGSSINSAGGGVPGNAPPGTPQGVSPVAAAMMIVMPLFMGAVTAAQTGGISLSREGSSFWFLRSSPVEAKQVLLAKFTYALLPQVLFILAFETYVAFTELPQLPLWLALSVGTSAAIGVASLQMLLDVFFPDFTIRIEMGSSRSGKGTGKLLTTLFVSMGLVALIGFVLSIPVMLTKKLSSIPLPALTIGAYALVVSISAALCAFLFGPGAKRLGKMLSDM